MTEETTPHMPAEPPVIDHDPPPQNPPPAADAPEPRPQRSSGPGLAILALLGVIILAGAVAWLRENPQPLDLGPLDARLAGIEQRLGALESRPAAKAPDMQPLERRIAALEQREPPAPADTKPLEQRIAALEQRQPPAPPDLRPLDARIAALEKSQPDLKPLDARIAAVEQRQPPDLKPLDGRIAALEKAQPDLKPLDARIAALEQKPAAPDETARAAAAALAARFDAVASRSDALAGRTESASAAIGALGTRIDSLTTRVDGEDGRITDLGKAQAAAQAQVAALGDKLAAQVSGASDKLAGEIAGLDGKLASQNETLGAQIAEVAKSVSADNKRLASAEQGLSTLPGLAERATRLTRIEEARQALDNGQKLGAIDGAPPALAKFADAAPPTEAQLRVSFPDAARAAAAASRPQVADKPFLDRAWAKAQTLVTVRQGDKVLVGDPAAGVLAKARKALDSGDLQGAADAAGALTGPAADAMAPWLSQARDLLAARAALAALSAHG